MLFIYLLMNCVILTLIKNVDYQFNIKYSNNNNYIMLN